MKDYYDLLVLIKSNILEMTKLSTALKHTFDKRNTKLTFELKFEKNEIQNLQIMWTSFLTKWGLDDVDKNFEHNLFRLNEFMEKIL